jgi:hypothetical protein
MADPILMAIAEHALAYGAMNAALDLRNRLEAELPPQERRSNDSVKFETDAPRWNVSEVFDFEADSALELISIEPTTLDGTAKLIQYVNDLEATGYRWPEGLQDDEKPTKLRKDWVVALHRNLSMTGAASAQQGAP